MKKLLQFFEDTTGNLSSTRLFMLLIVISVIIDYQHAIWTVGVWKPEWETIGLTLGSLGLKVTESSVKKNAPSKDEEAKQ